MCSFDHIKQNSTWKSMTSVLTNLRFHNQINSCAQHDCSRNKRDGQNRGKYVIEAFGIPTKKTIFFSYYLQKKKITTFLGIGDVRRSHLNSSGVAADDSVLGHESENPL